jgi:hypothetical protein
MKSRVKARSTTSRSIFLGQPVEVGDRLEAADAGAFEPSLQASLGAFEELEAHHFLDDLTR